MKQFKKTLKQINFETILAIAASLLALYMMILLVIGLVISLQAYFLAAVLSFTIFYIYLQVVNLFISDIKNSILLDEMRELDGLNIAQRTIQNLKSF